LAKATNEPLKTDESTARRYPTLTTIAPDLVSLSLGGGRAEADWPKIR
jgi:hypothetical protein